MPVVDIIISTYNRPKALKHAIESVLSQTFQDWHCWVCEDGNEKTIKDLLLSFQDSRLSYVFGTHCGYPSIPRNRGIVSGKSKYISFLDDDDYWMPNKLELQIAFFDKNPQFSILGSNAYNKHSEKSNNISKMGKYLELNRSSFFFSDLLKSNIIIHSSAIIKRDTLSKTGLFNEAPNFKAMEDYELWLRIALFGIIFIFNEPLLVYTNVPHSSIRKEEIDISVVYKAIANFTNNTKIPYTNIVTNIAIKILCNIYASKMPIYIKTKIIKILELLSKI